MGWRLFDKSFKLLIVFKLNSNDGELSANDTPKLLNYDDLSARKF